MGTRITTDINPAPGDNNYVVEGATLQCSLGSSTSNLQLPNSDLIFLENIKQASIGDHIGGTNILSFGLCFRSDPPPPCIMATSSKWVNGKNSVLVGGDPALLESSVNLCACGGVVSIADRGL